MGLILDAILGSIAGLGKWIWHQTLGKRAYKEKIRWEELRRKEEELEAGRRENAGRLIEQGEWEMAREAAGEDITDEELREIYEEFLGW